MNQRELKTSKKPWPTKDAMEQVYQMHLWGSNDTLFYSGEGSHNPIIVRPYLESISVFLNSFNDKLTVCDLGCGDFNIGSQLVKYTSQYYAVDIVPELIALNSIAYTSVNLKFKCLDIAVDELPVGDCAILRQVLQHLSNAEIIKILEKLVAFKYLIITEHLPQGEYKPNEDIISGQGTRLKKQSGVQVLLAPFNLKIKEEKQLSSVVLKNNEGTILTTLYTLF